MATTGEAIKKWEAKHTDNKSDVSKEVLMYGQIPPIEKMDTSLSVLTCCEKLSLSSNCIENITNLDSFKNLKILSLSRNNIKSLVGVEAVRDTLEELWISYNFIEKLTGVNTLQKLKVLSIRHNLVKDWAEFGRLADLPVLENLVFKGNPLEEKYSIEGNWIEEASKRLPKLQKLDGTLLVEFQRRNEA